MADTHPIPSRSSSLAVTAIPPSVGAADEDEDETEERDADKLVKEELLRLQRQYRQMEIERQEYSIQSGSTVNSQRRRVIFFENERDDILAYLNNALSEKYQKIDRETVRVILEILECFATNQLEIDNQLNQIAEMDEQVNKIKERVLHQKLKVIAIFGHSMTAAQAEKHKRVLEDRLHRATTGFDTEVTHNNEIRHKITHHLMDRKRFHEKYRSIKQRIVKMKRHMGDLVDIAASTYDQREECVAKIKAIRERNDRESKSHVLDMKENYRVLHNDDKSRDFMGTKLKTRSLLEEDDSRLGRLQNAKEKYYDDLLKSYRKSFRNILMMSESHDIQSLIQTYLAQEDKNFSRFQYLSTINSELDFLQRAVGELREIIAVKAAETKMIKEEQKASLRKMEEQFEESLTRNNDQMLNYASSQEDLVELIASLQEIFDLAGCDKSQILHLLGGTNGRISRANLDVCIFKLENRIQDLQGEVALLDVRRLVEIENGPLPTKFTTQYMASRKPMGKFMKPRTDLRLDPGGNEDEDEDKSSMYTQKPYTFDKLREELLFKYRVTSQGHISRVELEPVIDSDLA